MAGPRNKAGKPASEHPVLIELGETLASRRRETGRLQQEVAEAAGVSRSTLHTIEHGGAGVRFEKFVSVAHALGLEVGFYDPADCAGSDQSELDELDGLDGDADAEESKEVDQESATAQ